MKMPINFTVNSNTGPWVWLVIVPLIILMVAAMAAVPIAAFNQLFDLNIEYTAENLFASFLLLCVTNLGSK